MPLLKIYDGLAQYWSKTNTHRPSTAAAYLPIWHTEVRWLIASRTTRSNDKYRFSNIFPALWIPDILCVRRLLCLFTSILPSFLPAYIPCSMRRLESGDDWSLFDPYDVPSLPGLSGDAFSRAYEDFEQRGVAVIRFPAKNLWGAICDAQRESGTPFLSYADNINRALTSFRTSLSPSLTFSLYFVARSLAPYSS